jgi:hypothetical protein
MQPVAADDEAALWPWLDSLLREALQNMAKRHADHGLAPTSFRLMMLLLDPRLTDGATGREWRREVSEPLPTSIVGCVRGGRLKYEDEASATKSGAGSELRPMDACLAAAMEQAARLARKVRAECTKAGVVRSLGACVVRKLSVSFSLAAATPPGMQTITSAFGKERGAAAPAAAAPPPGGGASPASPEPKPNPEPDPELAPSEDAGQRARPSSPASAARMWHVAIRILPLPPADALPDVDPIWIVEAMRRTLSRSSPFPLSSRLVVGRVAESQLTAEALAWLPAVAAEAAAAVEAYSLAIGVGRSRALAILASESAAASCCTGEGTLSLAGPVPVATLWLREPSEEQALLGARALTRLVPMLSLGEIRDFSYLSGVDSCGVLAQIPHAALAASFGESRAKQIAGAAAAAVSPYAPPASATVASGSILPRAQCGSVLACTGWRATVEIPSEDAIALDDECLPAPAPTTWDCPRCTLINPLAARQCSACGANAPPPPPPPSDPSPQAPPCVEDAQLGLGAGRCGVFETIERWAEVKPAVSDWLKQADPPSDAARRLLSYAEALTGASAGTFTERLGEVG